MGLERTQVVDGSLAVRGLDDLVGIHAELLGYAAPGSLDGSVQDMTSATHWPRERKRTSIPDRVSQSAVLDAGDEHVSAGIIVR
jgi:hypothetical protein